MKLALLVVFGILSSTHSFGLDIDKTVKIYESIKATKSSWSRYEAVSELVQAVVLSGQSVQAVVKKYDEIKELKSGMWSSYVDAAKLTTAAMVSKKPAKEIVSAYQKLADSDSWSTYSAVADIIKASYISQNP